MTAPPPADSAEGPPAPRGWWRNAGRLLSRNSKIRMFRRDKRGATAVEFALVAFPFFALMLAIIETGLVFFASQSVESAVDRGARLVRTGQAQDFTLDDFRDAICASMILTNNCSAKMRVDVRVVEDFAGSSLGTPLDDEGALDEEDFAYDAGNGGSIVVVRAFYEWPIYLSFLGLGNMANGNHLIAATTAFRNEPF